MEDQINKLSGGYYRSFKKFKQQVEYKDDRVTFLHDCARFLQESIRADDDPRKVSFTKHFFENYGKQLAGACGCSGLVLDHQLIKVTRRDIFVDLMHAALSLGVIDCYSDHLARNVHAVFDVGLALSTLQRKLRTDTLQADLIYDKLKSFKE